MNALCFAQVYPIWNKPNPGDAFPLEDLPVIASPDHQTIRKPYRSAFHRVNEAQSELGVIARGTSQCERRIPRVHNEAQSAQKPADDRRNHASISYIHNIEQIRTEFHAI